MTVEEVLNYYGGVVATAKALGIRSPSVSEWVRRGYVPQGRQWEIQAKTAGKLQADQEGDAA